MKLFTKKQKKTTVDDVIDSLISDMESMDSNTDEYATVVNNLLKLSEVKTEVKKSRISPDTLLVIGGNILGIIIILSYEEKDIITSKAMSFIGKGRV